MYKTGYRKSIEDRQRQSTRSCKQPYNDLTGKRINGLIVAWPVGYSGKKYPHANWLCFCDCGNSKIYNTVELGRRGVRSMKSCGCIKRNEKSALTNLFAQYRYKAKTRGFEWGLSLFEFESLVTSPCYYTGRLPQQLFSPRGYKDPSPPLAWNGIDRRDNTKGYTIDNCVPAWGVVNKMKLTMSEKEFITVCKEIAKQHNKGE